MNACKNTYFGNTFRLYSSIPSFYYRTFADEAENTETNATEESKDATKENEVKEEDPKVVELKNKVTELENDVFICYLSYLFVNS